MGELNQADSKNECPVNGIDRRKFLGYAGWGALFSTFGAFVVTSIKFLFPRVLFEPPLKFKIGLPEDFKPPGNPDTHGVYIVDERWKDSQRVWVVRQENRVYAMFTRCTHLGCTPNWFPEDGIFKCPCHGSQYYSTGINFAGPAPRPLDRFAITIGDDGKIVVDKSKLYSVKDFDDPGSYVEV